MRTLKTSEAAAVLNVSPNTLRAWERRFGFPKPRRAPGKHRLYAYGEIAALRDALNEGLSIGAAISRVREQATSERYQLQEALLRCDAREAEVALDGVLAMGSVEQAVAKQILPVLDEIADAHGVRSAIWGFGAMWALDWLIRARRLSRVGDGGPLVLLVVGDGLSPVTIRTYALHLMLNREGVRVLMVPSGTADGAAALIAGHAPGSLILAGQMSAVDEQVWRKAMQAAVLGGPVLTYGRHRESLGMGHLPSDVEEAARLVVKLFDRAPVWPDRVVDRARMAFEVERQRV